MTAQQTFRNTAIVILTLVIAYVLYASAHILVVLLVSIIVASAVRPAVLWLQHRRFARGLAILSVYGAIAFTIFLLGVVVLPPAARQFASYIENDQRLADRLIEGQTYVQTFIRERTGTSVTLFDPEAIKTTVSQTMDQLKGAVPALAGEFGGLVGDFVLVFVMGIYWLTAREQTMGFVLQLFPLGRRAEMDLIMHEIEQSMGAYVRGVVLVCSFVGIANFVVLTLFGVPNAVTLGFIVGLTTALPIIGGYVGAAAAVLLALLSSPVHALIALGSFVAVAQIENHFLTPRVMSTSVDLNPILVIVVLFIGFALGGVVGALIAVPIASTLSILLRHLIIQPRREETAPQLVEGGILLPGSRMKDSTTETNSVILAPAISRSSESA